jgi:hypothetical protein
MWCGPDADRFHSDTSGEEFQRHKARYTRHMSIIEGKRLAVSTYARTYVGVVRLGGHMTITNVIPTT